MHLWLLRDVVVLTVVAANSFTVCPNQRRLLWKFSRSWFNVLFDVN